MKLHQRPAGLILLIGSLFAVSACANHQRVVKIDSRPRGAAIYINGEFKSETADNVELDYSRAPDGRQFIQVLKKGLPPGQLSWTISEASREKQKTFELE